MLNKFLQKPCGVLAESATEQFYGSLWETATAHTKVNISMHRIERAGHLAIIMGKIYCFSLCVCVCAGATATAAATAAVQMYYNCAPGIRAMCMAFVFAVVERFHLTFDVDSRRTEPACIL